MKKMTKTPGTSNLRESAEKVIKKKSANKNIKLSETDTLKLLHELEVHQVELEMQNEELTQAREEAVRANEKVTSLYDFAHTGYFTIDRDCKITKLNLSAALMLGIDRSTILNRNFRQFVTIDTLTRFNEFVRKVFETNIKETCHIRLLVKRNQSNFVQIEGIVSDSDEKCQITVIDESMHKRAEELLDLKTLELAQFDDFMRVKSQQMTELKKEINFLLKKLGEKEKFKLEE